MLPVCQVANLPSFFLNSFFIIIVEISDLCSYLIDLV